MKSRLFTTVLLVGIVLAGFSLFQSARGSVRLPGNDRGYQPAQPIAYSHQTHAGKLAIPCLYCHSGAEKSRLAGVPSASVCMNCHRYVTAALGEMQMEERQAETAGREVRPIVSPELAILYAAQGLGEDLQPVAGATLAPIAWKRVHSVPDFVAFDHRPHVAAEVDCQRCHGAIEAMERVRQESTLSMGWCVDCHRTMGGRTPTGKPVEPPLDCATCHY
jgi:hypothetical protein